MSDTLGQWDRIKRIFQSALDQAPVERAAFLNDACAGSAELRAEVESLLAAHAQAGDFAEQPAIDGLDARRSGLIARRLEPGDRLGPYQIVEWLGGGGMGEVYKARDTRLGRIVAVKMLRAHLRPDPESTQRFAREARTLAALSHPHICPVFDVGHHDDVDFLVMEFVEGETLAARLAMRALPLRDALAIATQIAEALEAAHAKGIVHRDLKPANILLHGTSDFDASKVVVKVVDFGLATAAAGDRAPDRSRTTGVMTGEGTILGTAGYMSPEQARGKPTDKRTDIWAFGCVLYEMLTGRPPFPGETLTDTIVSVLEREPNWQALPVSTPTRIRDLLRRSLQKDPERRLRDAGDARIEIDETLTASERAEPTATAPSAQPRTTRVRRWAGAVAAIVMIVGVAVGAYVYLHRAPQLSDKNEIVLADFTNTTGDSVFDGALRQGLSMQLEQSPFFHLVPGDQIVQTLRFMQQPPDAPLTSELARQVCRRTSASVEIEGSIASLGSQYVLGLSAFDCQTGESLAREQVTAGSKEQVLAALSGAATALRTTLGEARTSLRRYDVPLEQATTSSLEALQAYNQGLQAFFRGDLPAAVPGFQRAVDLDSGFAIAYSWLGVTYGNMGDIDRSTDNVTRAYERRDRASEYEQIAISGAYNFFVTGNLTKAAQFYEQWTKTFPRHPDAWIALAASYQNLGRHGEAVVAAQEAVRLAPVAINYGALLSDYVYAGRLDAARAVVQQARTHQIEPSFASVFLYLMAFIQQDHAGMADIASRAWPDTPPGTREDMQGATAAYSGHLAQARAWTARAVVSAMQARATPVLAGFKTESALREALFGNAAAAQQAVTEAEQIVNDGAKASALLDVRGGAALALAIAGDAARAQTLAADLNLRFPEATFVQFGYLPEIWAALALNQGKPQNAIERLLAASSYELGASPGAAFMMMPVYLRGQAYLAAHQGAEAAREFQQLIDHPGLVGNSPLGALAHLGLGRAYAMQGDMMRAHTSYQEFLALWTAADPDIPILKQAKAEYVRLH
jgi:serine/threonine protein kinase/tetratricopeptide (TPR) repeat protein